MGLWIPGLREQKESEGLMPPCLGRVETPEGLPPLWAHPSPGQLVPSLSIHATEIQDGEAPPSLLPTTPVYPPGARLAGTGGQTHCPSLAGRICRPEAAPTTLAVLCVGGWGWGVGRPMNKTREASL